MQVLRTTPAFGSGAAGEGDTEVRMEVRMFSPAWQQHLPVCYLLEQTQI